jgi:hypothetical protein
VNHRWVLSYDVYLNSRGPSNRSSGNNRRAVEHEDEVVATFARLRQLTANFTLRDPDYSLFRKSDLAALTAVDIDQDSAVKNSAHTTRCMLLANASDAEICDDLGITDTEAVRYFHDGFYDIRSRLRNPHLIADLVFIPGFSQGGSNTADVEKMTAWMFGAAGFTSFKLGRPDIDQERLRASWTDTLRKNQELSAVLRRRLGFESIEAISAHLDNCYVTSLKAKAADDPSKGLSGVLDGMAKITKAAGGLQIADETSRPTQRVEAVQISMRLS